MHLYPCCSVDPSDTVLLPSGKCVVSAKSSKVHYCFYTTTIQCSDGIDIPTEIIAPTTMSFMPLI